MSLSTNYTFSLLILINEFTKAESVLMNKITKQQDKKNFNHKGIVFIKKKIINFTEHHKKRAKKRDFYFLKKGKFVNLKENFRIIFGSAIKKHTQK